MKIIKQIIKNKHNEKLACEFNLPDNNTSNTLVLILHALTGKKENQTINYLAKNLPEEGYTTLQFDFSGHGESEGKLEEATISKQLEDINSVLEQIKVNYKNLILIGHSFSVLTALAFAKSSSRVKTLILLSGRAKYMEYIEKLEKVGSKCRLINETFIDKSFVDDYKKYDPLKNIKELKIPLLIIHGDKDETVPLENANLFYKTSSSAKKFLKIIKGADHRYSSIDLKKEVLDEVKAFLKQIAL